MALKIHGVAFFAMLFATMLAGAHCDPIPPGPPEPPPTPTPTPPPPTPPLEDGAAPPTDIYEAACANERQLGCGVKDNCAEVFRHAVETRITVVSEQTAECIAGARSKEAVRACGYADCP